MNIFEAIILGIVQGLTEFIPVSSSGHLVLMHEVFGVEANGLTFDVALHFGTLLALLVFFHKDILLLIKGFFGKDEYTPIARFIAIATIPAVIAGMLLNDLAESTFRSPMLVAINLMIAGGLMLVAEAYAQKRKHGTPLMKIRLPQAVTMGFAQAVALIPGVSRSGITITAGLFAGMERVAATRFSFLLAIPITTGAILKVALDSGAQSIMNESGIFLAGITASFLSGLFAIRFLIRYLSKHSLAIFAYYRFALGGLVLITLMLR